MACPVIVSREDIRVVLAKRSGQADEVQEHVDDVEDEQEGEEEVEDYDHDDDHRDHDDEVDADHDFGEVVEVLELEFNPVWPPEET